MQGEMRATHTASGASSGTLQQYVALAVPAWSVLSQLVNAFPACTSAFHLLTPPAPLSWSSMLIAVLLTLLSVSHAVLCSVCLLGDAGQAMSLAMAAHWVCNLLLGSFSTICKGSVRSCGLACAKCVLRSDVCSSHPVHQDHKLSRFKHRDAQDWYCTHCNEEL